MSAVRHADDLEQWALPAFVPSHCAWRSVARHRRKPVTRRGGTAGFVLSVVFAEFCTTVGVALQLQV
jgi:hypothetical protein